jgi:Flp pilus assembly protein TadG
MRDSLRLAPTLRSSADPVDTATVIRRRRARGESGASAVEFALVAPLLFLLIAGVIEFGWAFHQVMDLRHGARETARLVAVNYRATSTASGNTQRDQIVSLACTRMDADAGVLLVLDRVGSAAVGGTTRVTVSRPLETVTGMLDFVLAGKTLTSSVQTRQEQVMTWSETASTGQACP